MATTSAQSLDDIMSGVQNFIRNSVQASQQTQQNTQEIAKKLQETAGVYQTVAQDSAVITATAQAAQLKVQQQNAQIARAAGIDPEAGANIILETVSNLRRANAETATALKDYRAKNEVNFFQNPIDYVVGQVTLPFAEAKLEGAAKESQLYAKQLNDVNASLQSSFQTTEKLKESTSAASAESATRIAAAQALINANQTSIDALKYNNIGIKEAQEASKDQLQAMYTANSAQNAVKQLEIAQGHMTLDLERFNWQTQEKQAMDAAKLEGKQVDESVIESINLSRASAGLTQITGNEAKTAVQLLKSGASKDMAMHYENGNRIKSLGGRAMIGATPAESLEFMSSIQTNLPDIRKETTAILTDAMSALALNKTIDKKDKQAAVQFINTHVKETTAGMYSSITPNSGNLFDVGDLGSYLTLGGIKDLPVVTKILAPLAAEGQKLDDPRLVLGFMKSAIKSGNLTTAEIAGLSTVYQKANLINQAARGFVGFGIIPPNAGKNYYAKVGTFGKPVDMTDSTDVQRYLSKELSKNVGNTISEDRSSSPFLRN